MAPCWLWLGGEEWVTNTLRPRAESPGCWAAAANDLNLIDSGDPALSADPGLDGSDDFAPPFCQPDGTNEYGDPLVDCTFPDQPYDEWLLDQGYTCNCNEDGCDRTLPWCCASGSCPACNWDESGCPDDSPDYCGNGTCK
ncbi:hypothetical protein F4825DRAFT_446587 [Nemania diffusa]|nr:hypothetical protein F4825DRAFT_446587 [Nemania diffusa]